MGIKAVILDRDGVITVEKGYVWRIEDMEFIPQTLELMKRAQERGYKLFVATNQGGIVMGLYTVHDFERFTWHMLRELWKQGIWIQRVYYCPHKPNGVVPEYTKECRGRKPMPGMLEKAIADYNIDVQHSYMIGDKETDMLAGQAVGLHTIMIGDLI